MTQEDYIELHERNQVLLEGVKKDTVDEYLVLLPLLATVVRNELLSAQVNNISDLSVRQLQRLIGRIERRTDQTIKPYTKEFIRKLKLLAEQQAEFAADAHNEYRGENIRPASAKIAYEEADSTPMSANGSFIDETLVAWVAAYHSRVKNAIQKNWAEGQAVSNTLGVVVGTSRNRFRDGLLYGITARQATTTINTIVQHVSTSAQIATMKAAGVKGYRWVSVLDSRTSAVCRSLSGKFFRLDQRGPRPPLHPNCRSTIVPSNSGESNYTEPTYYEWLKKQSPTIQDSVLGETRGRVFREGGLSAAKFADLQLDKNFKPITLDRMRELKPEIFRKIN